MVKMLGQPIPQLPFNLNLPQNLQISNEKLVIS